MPIYKWVINSSVAAIVTPVIVNLDLINIKNLDLINIKNIKLLASIYGSVAAIRFFDTRKQFVASLEMAGFATLMTR